MNEFKLKLAVRLHVRKLTNEPFPGCGRSRTSIIIIEVGILLSCHPDYHIANQIQDML